MTRGLYRGLLTLALILPGEALAQEMCGRLIARDPVRTTRDQAVLLFRDSGLVVRVADSTVTDSAGAFCFKPRLESRYLIALRKENAEWLRSVPAFLPRGVTRRAVFTVDFARDTIVADWGKETPVRARGGYNSVAYPQELRAVCVRGDVVLQFVVDTAGLVDSTSVAVLRSDDARFSRAVLRVMRRFRFQPATIEGVKVRQLVQQPFQFRPTRADECH